MRLSQQLKVLMVNRFLFWPPTRLIQLWRTLNQRAGTV